MRTLFTCSLNWEVRRIKGLMVLRVRPTSTRLPTNVLYTPLDNTAFNMTCVTPVGLVQILSKYALLYMILLNNLKSAFLPSTGRDLKHLTEIYPWDKAQHKTRTAKPAVLNYSPRRSRLPTKSKNGVLLKKRTKDCTFASTQKMGCSLLEK